MDFEDFKWRIECILTSLEHADEHNLYKILSELEGLILETKKEKYFIEDWERRVLVEIEDMNKLGYWVKPSMTQRDKESRLKLMRDRFRVALNTIIKASE